MEKIPSKDLGENDVNLEELAGRLRQHHLKVTFQRLEICKEIFKGPLHATAEDVYLKVKKNHGNLSLSTVYRTLESLVELEELKAVNVQGFQTLFDRRLDPHHHIICEKCGKIEDLDLSMDCIQVCAGEAVKSNYTLNGFNVVFYAKCHRCTPSSGKL